MFVFFLESPCYFHDYSGNNMSFNFVDFFLEFFFTLIQIVVQVIYDVVLLFYSFVSWSNFINWNNLVSLSEREEKLVCKGKCNIFLKECVCNWKLLPHGFDDELVVFRVHVLISGRCDLCILVCLLQTHVFFQQVGDLHRSFGSLKSLSAKVVLVDELCFDKVLQAVIFLSLEKL